MSWGEGVLDYCVPVLFSSELVHGSAYNGVNFIYSNEKIVRPFIYLVFISYIIDIVFVQRNTKKNKTKYEKQTLRNQLGDSTKQKISGKVYARSKQTTVTHQL